MAFNNCFDRLRRQGFSASTGIGSGCSFSSSVLPGSLTWGGDATGGDWDKQGPLWTHLGCRHSAHGSHQASGRMPWLPKFVGAEARSKVGPRASSQPSRVTVPLGTL